jgi:hypothetical protein
MKTLLTSVAGRFPVLQDSSAFRADTVAPQTIARFLTLALLIIAGYSPALRSQDAVSLSNEALSSLQAYEEQLADLESEFGPFDARLLEPLAAMEAIHNELGSYDRVASLQSRRLQIRRTALGFESSELIPLLEDMIITQLQLHDWEAVSDSLEHIRHLYAVNYGPDSEQVLATQSRQAQWMLAQVYLDRDMQRADLVLDTRDLYDQTLDTAIEKYGENSEALLPWLYDRALSLYYLVAMMNTDNGLGGTAIDEVIHRDGIARLQTTSARGSLSALNIYGPSSRIPVVDEDELVGVAYLRQAKGFLHDIEDIGEVTGNAELRGIAAIYKGDFNIMMRRTSGRKDYREAREILIEAGISPERIDRFFARPMALPMPKFFPDFAGLEAYQQSLLAGIPEAERSDNNAGVFLAWDEDLRAVSMPRPPADFPALEIEKHQIDLEFRLSTKGRVSSVDVLSSESDDNKIERTAWRALREMTFRPPFVDNRTQTVRNARIRYEYHAREEQ